MHALASLTVTFALFEQSAAQAPAPVTVLRAAVGPSGQVRNGDYVLDEERNRFDPAKDKQVVVFFQWQGTAGVHRMSVTWKSPDGASSSTSPIEYRSQDRRFGGYWPLTLSPSSVTGMWAAEATVDGQPAGRLTFDVGAATDAAAAAPATPMRHILTQQELFGRLSAAIVVLERRSAKGRLLDPAAALALGHGRLLTSMAAVDGADALVALSPDGKRQPVVSILGMNRLHDWIVLDGGPDGDATAPILDDNAAQVGDRCFSIEAGPSGSKTLMDGAITGRARTPSAGTRLVVNQAAGAGTPGTPVLSEFGEIVGVVGGALVPGISDLSELIQFRGELKGVPVVSASVATLPPGSSPVAFADAWSRGDIVHALEGREHVVSGGFAKGVLRDQTVHPTDQRQVFSSSDKEFVLFITWGPQARLKGMSALRVYDENNRVVTESKPSKLDVRPGNYPMVLTSWKLTVPTKPGVYRADVLIDGTPIWRGFVRVTD